MCVCVCVFVCVCVYMCVCIYIYILTKRFIKIVDNKSKKAHIKFFVNNS